jgi:tripartite-type tricarboxylate transporter receptor subunit TctC
MTIRRRPVLLGAAAAFAASRTAAAQGTGAAWTPDRPVRLVVPFAAGTSTDIIGRLIATQLARGLGGATVVVDNRAGAGGTIAALHVAQQPPDGTALLLSTIGTHAVNPHLIRDLQYDAFRDFAPIMAHSRTRILLVVRPQLGPRGMAEFVALARSRQLSVASPGTGTTGHLAHALLTLATGVETLHVPYRDGARAVTDLLSGQLDAMFYHTQFVRPHIEAGTMVGLGITGEGRSEVLPGVPSMAEAGVPQVDVVGWWSLHGPPGLPAPVVQRVNAVLNAALREPDTLATFARNGIEPMGGTPAELAAFQRREFDRWGEVVRRARMTAEG